MDRHANLLTIPTDRTQWRDRIELTAPLTIFAASVALGYLSARWLGEGYASLVFVLGISMIGAVSGFSVALISAIAAAFLFNFLVAAPAFAFRMETISDVVPPIVFAISAVLSGWLSGRLKDEAVLARRGAARLEYLLDASRALQGVGSGHEILAALRASSVGQSGIGFGLYVRDGDGFAPVDESSSRGEWQDIGKTILADETETARHGDLIGLCLKGNEGVIGLLIARTPHGQDLPDLHLDQRVMLPLARIVGLALERAQLVAQVFEVRAAAQAEEFKTSLLSSVSHDLRTPLTTIRTAASSLLAFGQEFDEATSAQLLGGIVEECDRLNHLTSNLLEMSRLQGGIDGLRLAVLPVGEMIRSLAARVEGQAGDDKPAKGRITVEAPRDEILVNVDPTLFELALVNIVQNALRYSPAASPVTIACTAEGADCAIAVTDAGSGIPAAEQALVFNRFYRGHAAPGAPKGSGLGLAIAKGFVEASRGAIAIASPVSDGRGTTITLRLPLAEAPPILNAPILQAPNFQAPNRQASAA